MGMTYPGLKRGLLLLKDVLERTAKGVENPQQKNARRAFINRHAWNIYDIGSDVLFLASERRVGSAYLLVRPALESLFKLSAAVEVPEFAAEKMLAEIREERRKLEQWRGYLDEADAQFIGLGIKELTEYEAELKQRYNVTTEKRWDIGEVARAGSMKRIHVEDYYLGSAHVHAMMRSLTTKEDARDGERAVQCMTRTVADAVAFTNHFFFQDVSVLNQARALRGGLE